MFHLRHPWIAALLASTLLLAQTAGSWMHVGCVHDHSAAHAHAHHHHSGCSHHDHCDGDSSSDASSHVSESHRHTHVGTAHECPACRFLLVSSLAVELHDLPLVEAVALCSPAVAKQTPVAPYLCGYFSRGPPQLG